MTGAETADVVVIGGGVNGASAAFWLARAGAGRVVLLERGYLAAGASGKSGALVRMHYTNEPESRLAYESLQVFRNWAEIVGGDCGWTAPGFLQVVAPEYEAALRANVATQRRIGIDTRVVSADEVRDIAPGLYTDDLTYAAWEPGSGYADPVATTYGFARRAAELGVAVRLHTPVEAIETAGGRVAGVRLAGGGRIAAPTVVLAGGAWANRLLQPLGCDFGLAPHRVQVAVFRWPPGVTAPHPVVIDSTRGSWFRPEGVRGTLIGVELGVGLEDPDGYDEGVDGAYVRTCREALTGRMPAMADAPMRGGWAGMIMMSPDGRPIIDRIAAYDGLFCMAGDSGTSFKTAPAIGRCLAEWITEGAPRTTDLAPFRAARFAEGRPWVDEHAYGEHQLRATISR